jgi:hypothetical protein
VCREHFTRLIVQVHQQPSQTLGYRSTGPRIHDSTSRCDACTAYGMCEEVPCLFGLSRTPREIHCLLSRFGSDLWSGHLGYILGVHAGTVTNRNSSGRNGNCFSPAVRNETDSGSLTAPGSRDLAARPHQNTPGNKLRANRTHCALRQAVRLWTTSRVVSLRFWKGMSLPPR